MRLFKKRIKQNCYLKLFSRSNIFTDNFYVFKEDKDEGEGEDIFERLILLKHLLWFVAASTPIKVNKLSSHRYLGWLFFESKFSFCFLPCLNWKRLKATAEKKRGNYLDVGSRSRSDDWSKDWQIRNCFIPIVGKFEDVLGHAWVHEFKLVQDSVRRAKRSSVTLSMLSIDKKL